jgi:hypothetical protein
MITDSKHIESKFISQTEKGQLWIEVINLSYASEVLIV